MLSLGRAERERLLAGAAAVAAPLDAHSLDRFCRFADLLDEWASKTNLIACPSAGELVDRHLLDSLALVSLLPEHATIVDLGSGAGFPGVPLAIVRPGARVILVEARRRRASFLREVRRMLGLSEVQVYEARAEQGPLSGADRVLGDVVVSRAVWSDESILPVAARWLVPTGVLLWMRAAKRCVASEGATQTLYGEMVFERAHPYRIGRRAAVVQIFRRDGKQRFT